MHVSNYSLTVNREQLLTKLRARRDEIAKHWDGKLAEVNEELEAAKDPNKAWADYYAEMAKRVKNGTLVRDDSKPRGEKWVPAPGQPAQPTLPTPVDVEALDRQRQHFTHQKEYGTKPYDTAIDLLEIAVGETVEIPTSEYENLLKKPVL
jgi:hypothetical protein